MTTNASDPRQQAAAGRLEKRRRRQLMNDLRSLASAPEGRRVLWTLLGRCGVFASVYAEHPFIYYRAGQQDIGHWLLEQLEAADPQAFARMSQEAKHQERADDTELEAARTARLEEEVNEP